MSAAAYHDPDREPDDGDNWDRADDSPTTSRAEHEADIRRSAAYARGELEPEPDLRDAETDFEADAAAEAYFAAGGDPDGATGRAGTHGGEVGTGETSGAGTRASGPENGADGDSGPELSADLAEAVARLAALHELECSRELPKEAKRLGVGVRELRAAVAAVRAPDRSAADGDDLAAAVMASLNLVDHEPWPKPVDGVELFNAVAAVVRRYTYMRQGSIYAAALWAIFTHCREAFAFSPRLAITAPERECGKSTLMEVVAMMAWRACLIGDPTGPVLFRTIEAVFPTLFVDEAEMGMEDRKDLIAILNMGWRKGWRVARNVEIGGRHVPTGFNTFTPVAVAKIGKIKGAFGSRCIPIVMHKAPHLVPDLPLEGKPEREAVHIVGRKIAKWAAEHVDALRDADPAMPDGMKNRLRNNWRPLFAIAEALGVPERAAEAYAELVTGVAKSPDDEADGTRLLRACKAVIGDRDRVTSAELAKALGEDELSPWHEYGPKREPITQVQLARVLSPYGIAPKKLRFRDEGSRQGYERAAFEGPWREFLGVDDRDGDGDES